MTSPNAQPSCEAARRTTLGVILTLHPKKVSKSAAIEKIIELYQAMNIFVCDPPLASKRLCFLRKNVNTGSHILQASFPNPPKKSNACFMPVQFKALVITDYSPRTVVIPGLTFESTKVIIQLKEGTVMFIYSVFANTAFWRVLIKLKHTCKLGIHL